MLKVFDEGCLSNIRSCEELSVGDIVRIKPFEQLSVKESCFVYFCDDMERCCGKDYPVKSVFTEDFFGDTFAIVGYPYAWSTDWALLYRCKNCKKICKDRKHYHED